MDFFPKSFFFFFAPPRRGRDWGWKGAGQRRSTAAMPATHKRVYLRGRGGGVSSCLFYSIKHRLLADDGMLGECWVLKQLPLVLKQSSKEGTIHITVSKGWLLIKTLPLGPKNRTFLALKFAFSLFFLTKQAEKVRIFINFMIKKYAFSINNNKSKQKSARTANFLFEIVFNLTNHDLDKRSSRKQSQGYPQKSFRKKAKNLSRHFLCRFELRRWEQKHKRQP